MGRDRPRQWGVRAGRGGDADPARDRLLDTPQRRHGHPAARGERRRIARRHGAAEGPAPPQEDLQNPPPHDGSRRAGGGLLSRSDARSRLSRRREDRHGPDLGREEEGVEAQPLQLLLRGIHQPRGRRPGSRRGGPHRGGAPDDRTPRPPGDARHVVRAVPTHRDERHHHAGPPPASDRRRSDPRDGPVTEGYGTLALVSDDPTRGTPIDPTVALTADDLVRITGGRLLARSERPIRGAAVDSRLVHPDNMFAALPGERTDGHLHLDDAVARGAAALLVMRQVDDVRPYGDLTIVRVADGLAALGAVAAAWRRRFDPLVVGITGSIAKTATKEAVATVLGATRRTLKTEGNQNNEIGLPLTLMRLGPEDEAAVLEMGMYTSGEIADLAAMARPSIGVLTAVQRVPLSTLGSLGAIQRAKAELLEAPPASGTTVLNADDPIVDRMDRR